MVALTYEVKKLTKDLAASNTAQQVSEPTGKGQGWEGMCWQRKGKA